MSQWKFLQMQYPEPKTYAASQFLSLLIVAALSIVKFYKWFKIYSKQQQGSIYGGIKGTYDFFIYYVRTG
jgi:hypothetical protein